MKTKYVLMLALLGAAPSLAIASPRASVAELAGMTGLTERQVRMVVGGHTAYAEYLTQYDYARRRFVQVLGADRYNELMAGRDIVLDDGRRVSLASLEQGATR